MGLLKRIRKNEFLKIGSIGAIKSLRNARLEITFPADMIITHYTADGNEKGRGVDSRPAKGNTKRKR